MVKKKKFKTHLRNGKQHRKSKKNLSANILPLILSGQNVWVLKPFFLSHKTNFSQRI